MSVRAVRLADSLAILSHTNPFVNTFFEVFLRFFSKNPKPLETTGFLFEKNFEKGRFLCFFDVLFKYKS
jgi:hypothetical protein